VNVEECAIQHSREQKGSKNWAEDPCSAGIFMAQNQKERRMAIKKSISSSSAEVTKGNSVQTCSKAQSPHPKGKNRNVPSG